MIKIEKLAPGYFRFETVWTRKSYRTPTTLIATLKLTGPDGIETERKLTWKPPVDRIKKEVGMLDFADQINAVQSWRAVMNGTELSIGVADPEHYSGTVTLELV